jgi:hypothetical protein
MKQKSFVTKTAEWTCYWFRLFLKFIKMMKIDCKFRV